MHKFTVVWRTPPASNQPLVRVSGEKVSQNAVGDYLITVSAGAGEPEATVVIPRDQVRIIARDDGAEASELSWK
jgi:hypothetical protein